MESCSDCHQSHCCCVESSPDYAKIQGTITDVELLAAAGGADLTDLSYERALAAVRVIVDSAPGHIQDNLKLCCAYYIYRTLLIKAVANNDIGQIYTAQTALDRFHEQ